MTDLTDVETLRKLIEAEGISTEDITDETLQTYIDKAINLADIPGGSKEDYVRRFKGDTYVTDFYPLLPLSDDGDIVTLTIDDEQVTPDHVCVDEGIIYLDKPMRGKLTCNYNYGLSDEDVTKYILPIACSLFKDNKGDNVASITEGDISISYDNTSSTSDSTDSLIAELRNKYNARVKFI